MHPLLRLLLQKKKSHVVIIVDDNGPGMNPDLYEEVFKPFYRVDVSRNASTGGVGLGLSIARDAVHSHGGDIRLDKSPMGGLRAEIILPRINKKPRTFAEVSYL